MGFNKPVRDGVRPSGMGPFINHGAAVASVNNTRFQNDKISE